MVRRRAYFTMVPGNAPTSGSVVTTPDIPARHASATIPPQLIKRSPVSTYLSNDGQLGIHMFHVKPWADTINVRHRERHPEFTSNHWITGERHRVSRETRLPTIHKPHQWLISEDDGGAETLGVSAPLRSKDQSRLFLVKRCSRRQRIDQAGEVLITRELNGDTPLLRSTCHLHASVEGIGQPG